MALETSGGFGDSILNGLIPVLMVWLGRYHFGLADGVTKYRLFGGKPLLAAVFVFFLCTLILEIRLQTRQMAKTYEPFEAPVHNVEEIE